jgi:hypothetical protein
LTTCGLEEIPFLPPPVIDSSGGATRIIAIKTPNFSGANAEAQSRFHGIDIYYKFYKTTADIPPAEANINRQSSLSTYYNYNRLVTDNDELGNINVPLIEVAPADRDEQQLILLNFNLFIDFNDLDIEDEFPAEAHAEGFKNLVLRRGATYYTTEEDTVVSSDGNRETTGNSLRFKRFSDMSKDAPDLQRLNLEEGFIGEIVIAFYAVSYGKDDYLTTIYSVPVYLGTVSIPFTKR